MLEYKAQAGDNGMRLDVLIAGMYPHFTRSSLELLFDNEMVIVNSKPAKAGYKTRQNDVIKVDETYLISQPPAVELPVIYEDNNIIVIDKPAGLLTHSKGALNLEPTVASFIKPKLNDEGLSGNRAGIVHRLDRDTSGVIVAAKNTIALRHLQNQFAARKVKKRYIAVVEGKLEQPQAAVDAPIGRNLKKPQTFKVTANGKPAVTKYKVINSMNIGAKKFTELELEPLTGRTHQLRVHLAYIGHPIVGDRLYGHNDSKLMLHAKQLEFTLPDGARKVFSSNLPERFKDYKK
jgi:23S rRNA pseudouridine1911/1915/1917 synthase